MTHSPTRTTLPPETERMLEAVLADKVQNDECFFAIDVSNEVKTQGIKAATPTGFGKHSDMQEVVFDRMTTFMASDLYACTDFPYNVALDLPSRRLYHPLNTPQATIDAHENRKVIALPPVEVLAAQKSTQATGTQQKMVSTPVVPPTASDARDAAGIAGMVPPKTLGGHILDASKALGSGQP